MMPASHRIPPCLLAGVFAGSLAACSVGPDYQRPAAASPPAYKEMEGWKPAEPQQAGSNGPWWAVYNDPALDGLEQQVDVSNQTLKASVAAFEQARALVGVARAGYFPTVTLGAGVTQSGQGSGSSGTSRSGGRGGSSQTTFNLTGGIASWEIDVWGRIRRLVENAVATAQADAADVAAARLSAQAQLATDYFELRVADELKQLLDDTIAAYARSLEITRNQYAAGVAAQTDVITAETQLEGTQAQAINVGVQRAQLEHAIAVLAGKAPAELTIAPVRLAVGIPVVPPGLPSALLERNPTVAAAERQMAAANAEIGADIAAIYPTLTLTGSYGFQGTQLGSLVQAANSVWSVGPSVSANIFNAALFPAVDAARAAYDQTVANYRQTVLTSFEQVEDQLAALRILEQQAQVEDTAVKSAQEAVRLTLNQYQAGTVAYTSVVTAQAIALADAESALTILQSRLTASVALIEALGGGWDVTQNPTPSQIKDP